jgi:enoyl-CoA hydratase
MAEMSRFNARDAAEFATLGQELFATIERLPFITVALIDGDCFGGALDLVLSFDLRFATPRSRFSHPGAKLGIVTGFGGTSRWRKVLAPPAGRRLFLANEVLSSSEVLAVGLVDRVADSFDEELARLATLDPSTTRFLKELTRVSDGLTQPQVMMFAERLGHLYFGA